MKELFFARIGRQIVLMTSVGLVVMIGCLFILFNARGSEGETKPVVTILIWVNALVMVGVFIWGVVSKIKRYEIQGDKIIVVRTFDRKEITITSDTSLRADPNAMKGATRTMGNGGFLAVSGRFCSDHLGSFRAYISNPEQLVVIKSDGQVYVISPDTPENFVRCFEKQRQVSGGASAR